MPQPPSGPVTPIKPGTYINLDEKNAMLSVGGRPILLPTGKDGKIIVGNKNAEQVVQIDATAGADNLLVRYANQKRVFAVNNNSFGNACGVWIGAPEADDGGRQGVLIVRDNKGKDAVWINGAVGNDNLLVHDEAHKRVFAVNSNSFSNGCGVFIGAPQADQGGGRHGFLIVRDKKGADAVVIDGAAGDIVLANADCAEEFDVVDDEELTPGAVMVIEADGRLRQCSEPYDRRVAGVVAGAGSMRPGIVLGRQLSPQGRRPISLVGKVCCHVDARSASVEVGDLLTTGSCVVLQ